MGLVFGIRPALFLSWTSTIKSTATGPPGGLSPPPPPWATRACRILGTTVGYPEIIPTTKLELRTLIRAASTYISISLRVLYKVLMALSLAIQMARLWRGMPGIWTTRRLRQLGPPPDVKHCLWNRWTATTFLPLCDLYLIIRSMCVLRLDHEINYCKTIMVCNE